MGSPLVNYAESKLGVHKVYTDSQASLVEFNEVSAKLAEARADKGFATANLSDRELHLIGLERSKHSDLSQAAFDRHMKMVIKDDGHTALIKRDMAEHDTAIHRLEARKSTLQLDIKIAIARMNELGGYFVYLATQKNHNNPQNS